ncbi:hypothetical protein K502DRAFT_350287 [Neoconidiobolus thromboides FSU 785]|nr:hypothetical protein K502DRAFT_350287 [Neoconidiobolus thromboides FSU 785]
MDQENQKNEETTTAFRSHQDFHVKVEDGLKNLQHKIMDMNTNIQTKLQEMESRLHYLENIYKENQPKAEEQQ